VLEYPTNDRERLYCLPSTTHETASPKKPYGYGDGAFRNIGDNIDGPGATWLGNG
jgi:hypothetical protein